LDPNVSGKRVGESYTQLFSRRGPENDESSLAIVTSFVDTTILSIVNAAIVGLADPS